MSLDPHRHSRLASASSSSLKRSYHNEFHPEDERRSNTASPVPSSSSQSSSSFAGSSTGFASIPDSGSQPPAKLAKLADTRFSQAPSQKMSYHTQAPYGSWRGGRSSAPSSERSYHQRSSRGGSKLRPSRSKAPVLSGPVHDTKYIETTYKTKDLKPEWLRNPKSPLSNYFTNHLGQSVKYEVQQMVTQDGKNIYRCTVTVPDEDGDIFAYGDSSNKKDAENLAALCALYQMESKNMFETAKKKTKAGDHALTQAKLTDGTVIDFDRARQFMDYYCRRFHFGKPDIIYESKSVRGGGTIWEAVMVVDGRRIGVGTGSNKKAAMISSYIDVTQYLESCDPDLWKRFVEDAKTGKDLGMAASFLFQMDNTIEDQVQDLCQQIRRSTLYRKRPKIGTVVTDPNEPPKEQAPPRYVAPNKRVADAASLAHKSQVLQERRKAYLENPAMEKMRSTRAALPVYTKSAEVLEHISKNEVTICMAATGSGKTTQIPQLILDQWIDKGEGAKCNIVCTQPRRIAAISVAGRVAAERGETVGKGSVGYQVRFESNLPEDHGSITFCTTGIFLKRMHSALQEGASAVGRGHQSLDDVTHLIVDEVHERDVDTDLLLVVLKRLLADRKARGKPLKIVLMSATIDPTLFQQYFADEQGKPASVIEIPGRSFPVQKQFLDDFVPQLISSSDSRTNWIFRDESVQKYIVKELGPQVLPPAILSPKLKSLEGIRDDDLDSPYPLVAYTISHVLRNSSDGHVLVFLAGWDDITGVQKCLLDTRQSVGINFNDTSKYSIHLLHSSIPVAEQQAIFEPPPPGVRRIILSTNIAETSVTIPDVVYVVDTAKIKENRYDPERHISSLVSAWVGASNLNQRAGRAGRHRPGEYYGILSRKRADELHPYQTVEMKRVDLSNVVMHVKALDFPGMTVEEVLAELIEPPAPERVAAAMQSLKMVGALDEYKNLTSLGRVLLQLPVDVQMGKMVLFGSFFRCLDSALTLAAILTNRDPFMSPMHLKQQAAEVKNSFSPEEYRSDALAILRAYNKWWSMQSRGEYVSANRFCMDNFLSKPTLLMIQKIKGHLLQSLYDVGVIDVSAGGAASKWPLRGKRDAAIPEALNIHNDSLPVLAALITIASQPKFAIRTRDKIYRTAQDKAVFVHPSSINNRKRLDNDKAPEIVTEKHILAYAEKRQNISNAGGQNAQKFLVTTTRIDALTYMLFGAYHIELTQRGLICDEWLPVVGRPEALDDVERLKILMEASMLRVFEGITQGRSKRKFGANQIAPREEAREEESGDEDDELRLKDYALTETEIRELDLMTTDIIRILNDYNTYRMANQSRQNSRPATPMDSPVFQLTRLPSFGGHSSYSGSRSGYSTPGGYNAGAAFSSRPGTPSKLSRRLG
ncbi:P-loop containing nucleoside triphosphate hydrolase protein [Panus rudis PR-1116 ss-1]|nr:P-loop containing nucleoside triphosphate hydrolase protein [Panus rudis PR-1116 ss-1]